MISDKLQSSDNHWKCCKCGCDLVTGPVTLQYLGREFKAELPKCPECGLVFISENLANGKLHDVEQLLEDK